MKSQKVRVRDDDSVCKRGLGVLVEDLIPSTRRKKHCYAHTCNPGAGGGDRQIPRARYPATLAEMTNSRYSERPCLQEAGQRATEQDT